MKIYTDDIEPENCEKLRLGGREPRVLFGGLALLVVLFFLVVGLLLLIYSGFDWDAAGVISVFSLIFLLISLGFFLKIKIFFVHGEQEIFVDRTVLGVCVLSSRYSVESIREILVSHEVTVQHDYSGPEDSEYMEKMGKGKYRVALEFDQDGIGWLRYCPTLIDDVVNCKSLVLAHVDFKDIAESYSDRVKKIIGLADCQQRYRYLFYRRNKPSNDNNDEFDS